MIVAVIRVPRPSEEGGEQIIEQRFASQLHIATEAPGFVSFQLLRPVAGSDYYLSLSTWQSRDDLMNWANSQYSAQIHARHGQAADAAAARQLPAGVEVYEIAVSSP